MAAIHEYEQGATRLGIAVLHEAGERNMDGWASDWWRADYEYLLHFYATGEKLDTRSLLKRSGNDSARAAADPLLSRRSASPRPGASSRMAGSRGGVLTSVPPCSRHRARPSPGA